MVKRFLLVIGIVGILWCGTVTANGMSRQSQSPRVIIWDLGGILIKISLARYACSIGLSHIVGYIFCNAWIPYHVCKTRSFEVLYRVPVPDHLVVTKVACIPGGEPMPPVMVAYQAGLLQRDDILPLVKATIETLSKENYFKGYTEKVLIESTIDAIFSPKTLSFCHYMVPWGMDLVRSLAARRFDDGTPRYKQYVLSNWEQVSFKSIYASSKEFFSLFEGIVISGTIGIIKPMREAFEYLIKTYNLDKAACIFIDDQEENIRAAQEVGIGKAILFKNFTQLKKELKNCGVTT